jgi:hypothetical protein
MNTGIVCLGNKIGKGERPETSKHKEAKDLLTSDKVYPIESK